MAKNTALSSQEEETALWSTVSKFTKGLQPQTGGKSECIIAYEELASSSRVRTLKKREKTQQACHHSWMA